MIKFSGNNVLIHSISPVIEVSANFQKRELILDESWDKDGKHYTSFVIIEFSGERMGMLNSFTPGQRVNVEGLLSGREYNNRIYNTVRGTNITPAQPKQQYAPQYPQQPAPGYPQQPAPAYSQPMGQQQYPPSTAPAQQHYNSPSGAPGVNDLPF